MYATAAYTGTYYPTVWALFSEPISSTTVTTETLTVTDQAGRRLAGIVIYDGTSSVVRFTLGEALSRNRAHTAMITSEVRDTSGNAMTADYVWVSALRESTFICPWWSDRTERQHVAHERVRFRKQSRYLPALSP